MKYIYALVDPRDKAVRYVGQTNDPRLRLIQHCASNEDTTKGAWIAEMRHAGFSPTLVILKDKIEDHDIDYHEKWWIVFGKHQGWQLTNSANPCRLTVNFGDLFSEQLRYEYDVFKQALNDDKPLVMISRGQFNFVVLLLKFIAAIASGVFVGYGMWLFEFSVSKDFFHPLWYGVAMGLGFAWLTLMVLTRQMRHKWMVIVYLVFYVALALSTTMGWS